MNPTVRQITQDHPVKWKLTKSTIVEMFKRSEENYGVKYINYGDGDSKTYSSIINSAPYADTFVIKKKCIGYVQKRMGSRLQECKEKNKGLGGKNKLTVKMLDNLLWLSNKAKLQFY